MPFVSPFYPRLRSCCLFRTQKKSKKMNVSTKKSQRITSKQHTQHTNYISKQFATNQRYSRIQHSSSHLVKRKSKLKKKKASRLNMTAQRCLTQSSFSFFLSSSSYTCMMRDRIESHGRMKESVRDTYPTKTISSTSCSFSKPPQSPLHPRLRSCYLFHTRK